MALFDNTKTKEKNPDLILKHARKNARKIVEEANLKAAKIIQEAEIFTLEARQYADKALIDAAGKAAEKMAEELRADFTTKETGLEKALGEEYEKAKLEIENYKLKKIKETEDKTHQMVKQIIEEFFASGIDIKDQETALLKALENAKHLF